MKLHHERALGQAVPEYLRLLPFEPVIRFYLPADLPQVMAIERASFDHPWSDEELRRVLGQARNCVVVAELPDVAVLGYVIFTTRRRSFNILSCGVHPSFRRRGVGSLLIRAAVVSRIGNDKTKWAEATTHETNLAAQCWLRSLGFWAELVQTDERWGDSYVFAWTPGQKPARKPTNSILER